MIILCSRCEDVIMYNDIIFTTICFPAKRILVTLDTNAIAAHSVSTWLNDTKFNQIHYMVVGALVMFTLNINDNCI